MSIDHIPLPAFLYRDIFGKNLVDLKENIGKKDTAAAALNEESPIQFLGGNEKQIVFLVYDDQNKFLADVQMKFLGDLLIACQLTMSDIALVNLFQHKGVTYRELSTGLRPKHVLLFGIPGNGLDLPFNIPFFQTQNFQEQVYMISPPIEALQLDSSLRKKLWECLQKIFNIRKPK